MKNKHTTLSMVMALLGFFAGTANATPESDFWQWFKKNEAALFNFEANQERTFDLLAEQMHKVHPSLTFEFGPKQGDKREFVISADGIREAFSKVESLFAAAPILPKWKVIKFRPRREAFDLEYSGISIKVSAIAVQARPDGKKVDLTVLIPGYTEARHDAYLSAAFLLLDQALGEYDVETHAGVIEVKSPSAVSGGAVTLQQLPKVFDSILARPGV